MLLLQITLYIALGALSQGLFLRWRLYRMAKGWHEGTEDYFGGDCTGDATCDHCQTTASCLALVWPISIGVILVYYLLRPVVVLFGSTLSYLAQLTGPKNGV